MYQQQLNASRTRVGTLDRQRCSWEARTATERSLLLGFGWGGVGSRSSHVVGRRTGAGGPMVMLARGSLSSEGRFGQSSGA
jgi:hypothetical protein